MAASGEGPSVDEALRAQAAGWLARLRGASTAEDHAEFEDWYEADPRHAAAYDAVLQSWETAGLARATPIGLARSGVLSAGARRWRYTAAAIAATVVIVLLAFAANGAGVMGFKPARPIEFASGTGQGRMVDLADGSRVTIGADSLLRIAYVPEERRVILERGRARFVVAHDSTRPFVVETPAGLVVAHGTVFDVAISGQRVTVSLWQGSVEVRPIVSQKRALQTKASMLMPGQRTVMVAGEPLPAPTRFEKALGDPKDSMLSFENASLGDVVAAANLHAATPIVLSDLALGKLRFTGTFHPGATGELAAMLAAMFDLRVSHDRGGAIVMASSRASKLRSAK